MKGLFSTVGGILALLGVAFQSAWLTSSHPNPNTADADGSSGVELWCSDVGIQYRVASSIGAIFTLSGSSRTGPAMSCDAGTFSTVDGADGETSLTAQCSRLGLNLLGYVKGFKIGAGGLGCTPQNNVTSKLYGVSSGQEIALDLQNSAGNYTGTNRFDNISSVESALVIYGDGGKVGMTPVGDGSSLDGQTNVATDGFVVTGGTASPWYMGLQLPLSPSVQHSQINVNLTAS